MPIISKPATVKRPGAETRFHWSGVFIVIAPFVIIAAMFVIDRQFGVWNAWPLKNNPTSPLIDFLVVGTIGFPFGAWGLLSGLRDVWRAAQSASWPTARGKVLTSEVVVRFGRGPRNKPVVCYEYEVGGQRYEGSTIHFSQRSYRLRASAEAVAGCYPVGGEVIVHYDQADPDIAVLEISSWDAYVRVLWGLAWLLFPFLAFFQFFRDIMHG